MRRLAPYLALAALVGCGSSAPATVAGNPSSPASTTSSIAVPTSRAHGSHHGSVLVVGDSLVVGADSAGLTRLLQADGWTVEIDATEGRSTRTGIVDVADRTSVPSLVLVEMGTNPSSNIAGFADEIRQMLDDLEAKGAKRVLWVTPHYRDDDRYDDKDKAIMAAAAADPTLVVADWHAIAAAHPEWMRSDGLHYTDLGYLHLAAFLSDQIDANDPNP
ncbi:MAG: hypothetical protein QOE63_1119 [Acidimicrobiaceae bacterium]